MSAPDVDRAIAIALTEHRLDERHAHEVRALLRQPRDRWPPCCGGLCDPCALAIHRVADRTLRLLGRGAPIPDPG